MDLFGNDDALSQQLEKVKGLAYVPQFLSRSEHDALVEAVDQEPWLGDLKRRVQHYGYKYDYTARSIDYSMYLGALPDWCLHLAERLLKEGYFQTLPDQVIVNEYHPGQGIAPHIDCVPCFTDNIVSISLLSLVEMDFAKGQKEEKELIQLPLEPCSLIHLQDVARYQWTHGIRARKSDVVNGQRQPRSRRISLTFRKVILP